MNIARAHETGSKMGGDVVVKTVISSSHSCALLVASRTAGKHDGRFRCGLDSLRYLQTRPTNTCWALLLALWVALGLTNWFKHVSASVFQLSFQSSQSLRMHRNHIAKRKQSWAIKFEQRGLDVLTQSSVNFVKISNVKLHMFCIRGISVDSACAGIGPDSGVDVDGLAVDRRMFHGGVSR